VGCLLEVAAASRQWSDSREYCRCYCFAEVEDGCLPFDCLASCGFHPCVLLIELDPCPLHIAECLAQVWIIAAFEYGSYPGDVSHGGSEASLAHGGELGV
jgi:hypothetical protein